MLGLGLCLAPWLVLAAVVASYLTLDSDVAVLRKQVMAATDAGWSTRVQMSVGRTTLGAIGTGLGFVHVTTGIHGRTPRLALGGGPAGECRGL